MKFIVKKDAETGKVLDAWQTQKEAAAALGVTQVAIFAAIKHSGKCKGFVIERINVDKDKVMPIFD